MGAIGHPFKWVQLSMLVGKCEVSLQIEILLCMRNIGIKEGGDLFPCLCLKLC